VFISVDWWFQNFLSVERLPDLAGNASTPAYHPTRSDRGASISIGGFLLDWFRLAAFSVV
jgi:hypothetical protein